MSYTSDQVMRVTGISQHMLHYLCRTSIVTPTLSRRRGIRGHGVARAYSFGDLVICRLVQKLAASGVSPLKVKKAVRELHSLGISIGKIPATRVVMFANSVYLWRNADEDPFRLADGQSAFGFIIDLENIRAEVAQATMQLAA